MDEESYEQIPDIEYPEAFKPELSSLNSFFPASVEFNDEDHSISFKKTLTREQRIASSYLRIVSEVSDIVENLNIVVEDLRTLARIPPFSPSEAERRYILLTKVFFYELLRIRDGLGRFLKRLENYGIVTKEQRRDSRKLLEEQFEEHYLIRNVFLHGHSMPRSKEEYDLFLMAMFHETGYKPELRPKDGSPTETYPETFRKLAVKRADALRKIGGDVIRFLQTLVDGTSAWIHEKEFGNKNSDNTKSNTTLNPDTPNDGAPVS